MGREIYFWPVNEKGWIQTNMTASVINLHIVAAALEAVMKGESDNVVFAAAHACWMDIFVRENTYQNYVKLPKSPSSYYRLFVETHECDGISIPESQPYTMAQLNRAWEAGRKLLEVAEVAKVIDDYTGLVTMFDFDLMNFRMKTIKFRSDSPVQWLLGGNTSKPGYLLIGDY